MEVAANSDFSLIGSGMTAQLALNGEVVRLNDLKMAGFSLVKSPVNHGNGEFCYRCAPRETGILRLWYEISITCNNVRGDIWVCSNCSTVYPHKSRGKALWTELIKCASPGNDPKIQRQISGVHTHYLPSKEDFESAYRTLAKPGEAISVDTVLDKIESDIKRDGHLLKDNWRFITEKNIEIWSGGN